MSRYLSKFRCLKGGGSLWTQISGGKGRPPPTIFGTRKVASLGYRMVKKIAEKFNRLSRVHQRYRQQTTDRQTTDGIATAISKRNVIRWRLLNMTSIRITSCALIFYGALKKILNNLGRCEYYNQLICDWLIQKYERWPFWGHTVCQTWGNFSHSFVIVFSNDVHIKRCKQRFGKREDGLWRVGTGSLLLIAGFKDTAHGVG